MLACAQYLPDVKILVVEDERPFRDALERVLRNDGYEVELAADGHAALQALSVRPPDAVVLDVLLPEVDGIEVCRRLRAAGDRVPVLMVTALDAVEDRVAGLDAGADDYLVKPFSISELRARVRALLRRAGFDEAKALSYADLRIDPTGHQVFRGERRVELTITEFALLSLLLQNARQVLTRGQIFDRVWGYDFGSGSRTLEVYIGYLRRKLEEAGEPRLIHTVRGVGYVLREEP
jgi:two-component system, OmpR family, response regulator MprA